MIDYEKLKIAHELIEKIMLNDDRAIDLTIKMSNDDSYDYSLTFYDNNPDNDCEDFLFGDIESLLTKLQELIKDQQRPKYKLHQLIWRIDDKNRPVSFVPEQIIKGNDGILYFDGSIWWEESKLYRTQEILIEAQMQYWNNLRYPSIIGSEQSISVSDPDPIISKEKVDRKCEKCDQLIFGEYDCPCNCVKERQHESDGMIYTSNPPQNKCKRCGVFY